MQIRNITAFILVSYFRILHTAEKSESEDFLSPTRILSPNSKWDPNNIPPATFQDLELFKFWFNTRLDHRIMWNMRTQHIQNLIKYTENGIVDYLGMYNKFSDLQKIDENTDLEHMFLTLYKRVLDIESYTNVSKTQQYYNTTEQGINEFLASTTQETETNGYFLDDYLNNKIYTNFPIDFSLEKLAEAIRNKSAVLDKLKKYGEGEMKMDSYFKTTYSANFRYNIDNIQEIIKKYKKDKNNVFLPLTFNEEELKNILKYKATTNIEHRIDFMGQTIFSDYNAYLKIAAKLRNELFNNRNTKNTLYVFNNYTQYVADILMNFNGILSKVSSEFSVIDFKLKGIFKQTRNVLRTWLNDMQSAFKAFNNEAIICCKKLSRRKTKKLNREQNLFDIKTEFFKTNTLLLKKKYRSEQNQTDGYNKYLKDDYKINNDDKSTNTVENLTCDENIPDSSDFSSIECDSDDIYVRQMINMNVEQDFKDKSESQFLSDIQYDDKMQNMEENYDLLNIKTILKGIDTIYKKTEQIQFLNKLGNILKVNFKKPKKCKGKNQYRNDSDLFTNLGIQNKSKYFKNQFYALFVANHHLTKNIMEEMNKLINFIALKPNVAICLMTCKRLQWMLNRSQQLYYLLNDDDNICYQKEKELYKWYEEQIKGLFDCSKAINKIYHLQKSKVNLIYWLKKIKNRFMKNITEFENNMLKKGLEIYLEIFNNTLWLCQATNNMQFNDEDDVFLNNFSRIIMDLSFQQYEYINNLINKQPEIYKNESSSHKKNMIHFYSLSTNILLIIDGYSYLLTRNLLLRIELSKAPINKFFILETNIMDEVQQFLCLKTKKDLDKVYDECKKIAKKA